MSTLPFKTPFEKVAYADKIAEAKMILEDAKDINGEFLLMATASIEGKTPVNVTKGACSPAFYIVTFVNFCADMGVLDMLISHAIATVNSRRNRREYERQAKKGGVAI